MPGRRTTKLAAIATFAATGLLGCTADGASDDAGPTVTEVSTTDAAPTTDAGTATTAGGTTATSAARTADELAADALDQLGEAGATTMRGVLEATGLLDDERLRGGYTVLAPTDEAFASLSLGDAADLAANPTELRPILERHLVPESVDVDELADRERLETLSGEAVAVEGGEPTTVGGASVVGSGAAGGQDGVTVLLVDSLVQAS